MRKVKILKVDASVYYDDCEPRQLFYPVVEDWDEVTDEEYEEIRQAVYIANYNYNREYKYLLIEYTEETMHEMFKSAKTFTEKMKKEEQKRLRAAEEAKKRREEKALERKRKQLEKLKKELGDG